LSWLSHAPHVAPQSVGKFGQRFFEIPALLIHQTERLIEQIDVPANALLCAEIGVWHAAFHVRHETIGEQRRQRLGQALHLVAQHPAAVVEGQDRMRT